MQYDLGTYKVARNPKGHNQYSTGRTQLKVIAGSVLIIIGLGILGANTNINAYLQKEITATSSVSFIAPEIAHADTVPTLEEKVTALKNQIADEMNACENPSHLLVWPDDNQSGTLPRKDKVSIGDMAFKLSTIQRFYKTLHNATLSDKDALQLGTDPVQARALAIDAWINIKGSVNEWSCVNDTMKTQINDVRFLLSK